jgi:hypothetical protein
MAKIKKENSEIKFDLTKDQYEETIRNLAEYPEVRNKSLESLDIAKESIDLGRHSKEIARASNQITQENKRNVEKIKNIAFWSFFVAAVGVILAGFALWYVFNPPN